MDRPGRRRQSTTMRPTASATRSAKRQGSVLGRPRSSKTSPACPATCGRKRVARIAGIAARTSSPAAAVAPTIVNAHPPGRDLTSELKGEEGERTHRDEAADERQSGPAVDDPQLGARNHHGPAPQRAHQRRACLPRMRSAGRIRSPQRRRGPRQERYPDPECLRRTRRRRQRRRRPRRRPARRTRRPRPDGWHALRAQPQKRSRPHVPSRSAPRRPGRNGDDRSTRQGSRRRRRPRMPTARSSRPSSVR